VKFWVELISLPLPHTHTHTKLSFSKSRTGSDVRYSCHHNSSPPSRSFTVRNKQHSLPAPAGCYLAARSHTPLAYTTNTSLFILTLYAYSKQQQASSLLPFRLMQMYSRVLRLAAPKNALHVFLSLFTKTVSNYRVVK
jgi:hypothetical protein